VPTVDSAPVHMGVRHDTTIDLIEAAIDQVQSLSHAQRVEMGANAREAFEQDQKLMLARLTEALAKEWN
ncbi:MAG: hypothetical protein ACLGHK_09410, partial [Alphaproteobacteria bacterium]